jgi:hypothetical protein
MEKSGRGHAEVGAQVRKSLRDRARLTSDGKLFLLLCTVYLALFAILFGTNGFSMETHLQAEVFDLNHLCWFIVFYGYMALLVLFWFFWEMNPAYRHAGKIPFHRKIFVSIAMSLCLFVSFPSVVVLRRRNLFLREMRNLPFWQILSVLGMLLYFALFLFNKSGDAHLREEAFRDVESLVWNRLLSDSDSNISIFLLFAFAAQFFSVCGVVTNAESLPAALPGVLLLSWTASIYFVFTMAYFATFTALRGKGALSGTAFGKMGLAISRTCKHKGTILLCSLLLLPFILFRVVATFFGQMKYLALSLRHWGAVQRDRYWVIQEQSVWRQTLSYTFEEMELSFVYALLHNKSIFQSVRAISRKKQSSPMFDAFNRLYSRSKKSSAMALTALLVNLVSSEALVKTCLFGTPLERPLWRTALGIYMAFMCMAGIIALSDSAYHILYRTEIYLFFVSVEHSMEPHGNLYPIASSIVDKYTKESLGLEFRYAGDTNPQHAYYLRGML